MKLEEENEVSKIVRKIRRRGRWKKKGIKSHNFNNRKVEFDNIKKEGGLSKNKDIKNVVVSFF